MATYLYRGASGDLLFETVRTEPKGFFQRRPDGRGGWINNLDGVEPVLYRLPELEAANPSELVFFVEGEKDVDRLRAAGLVATCNPMGAGSWQDQYADALRGRDVVILPDNDDPGRRHANRVIQGLLPVGRSVRLVELPGLSPKGDVSDWLDARHSASELVTIARETKPVPRTCLDDVVAVFRRYLHLPDPCAVFAVLGAYAANRMEGDPVWILIIGPASGGKTEVLLALLRLPDVRLVGTLTEPSLLSGVSKRDKVVGAKGGFLHEIGAFGIIVLKDFTSVLSMHRDARAAVLGALRECYDGSYSRGVGTDGGKLLSWTGKLGLVAGCTPSIDSHHAVISTMGERFVFLRLPPVDPVAQGMRALDRLGGEGEGQMRRELGEAVLSLFAGIEIPKTCPSLDIEAKRRLVALASLAVRCRSAVERDSFRREISLVPEPEAPARLVLILVRLLLGMKVVGVSDDDAWRVISKCALDSMPQLRRDVFELLRRHPEPLSTSRIAERTGYPAVTVRRACEDLTAHGVVVREVGGSGKTDQWALSSWALEMYAQAAGATVPEMSETVATATKGSSWTEHIDSQETSSLNNSPYTALDDFSEKVCHTQSKEKAEAETLDSRSAPGQGKSGHGGAGAG